MYVIESKIRILDLGSPKIQEFISEIQKRGITRFFLTDATNYPPNLSGAPVRQHKLGVIIGLHRAHNCRGVTIPDIPGQPLEEELSGPSATYGLLQRLPDD